jgi:uncharacterized membrane protein
LLVGSCSGLVAGNELLGSMRADGGTAIRTERPGGGQKKVIASVETPAGLVDPIVRGLYLIAALCGVAFAGAVLAKAKSFDARALLAWSAVGLAVLRLVLVVFDYMKLDAAMDAVHEQAQKLSGYSYAKHGQALETAGSIGGSFVVIVGVGLVIFWAVTAVSFWGTGSAPSKETNDALDRMGG